MNEVHFTNCIAIIAEEQRQLTAAKIAKTKVDNTTKEIRKAIAELNEERIKPTQANVIRRLTGKHSWHTWHFVICKC